MLHCSQGTIVATGSWSFSYSVWGSFEHSIRIRITVLFLLSHILHFLEQYCFKMVDRSAFVASVWSCAAYLPLSWHILLVTISSSSSVFDVLFNNLFIKLLIPNPNLQHPHIESTKNRDLCTANYLLKVYSLLQKSQWYCLKTVLANQLVVKVASMKLILNGTK